MAVRGDRFGKVVVEFLRDVARQFEVLLLVLAHGNVRGAIEQNVGRHQHRIIVKPHRGVLAVLASLFLELGHAVEPADPRHAIEDPRQFRVSGNLALVEDNMLLRIDAGGDEGRGHFTGIARELGRTAPHLHRLRQRMHVDHAIETVVGLLQLHEVDDRAEVIAEMQIPRRLDARKNPFNECHCLVPTCLCAIRRWRRPLPSGALRRPLPTGALRRPLPCGLQSRKSGAVVCLTALTASAHLMTPNRASSRQ